MNRFESFWFEINEKSLSLSNGIFISFVALSRTIREMDGYHTMAFNVINVGKR